MSVIRLETDEYGAVLIEFGYQDLQVWRTYSDPSVQVLAEIRRVSSNHTTTPIARRKDGSLSCD